MGMAPFKTLQIGKQCKYWKMTNKMDCQAISHLSSKFVTLDESLVE